MDKPGSGRMDRCYFKEGNIMSKQNLQNKVEEIRDIMLESMDYKKLDTIYKMFKAYEGEYKRIFKKLGDLELMIDNYKRE